LTDALKRNIPTMVFGTARAVTCALRVLVSIAPRRHIVLACDLTRANERILCGTARRVSRELPGLLGQDMTLIVAGKHAR
jgi:16S rRNA (cytidine1402-2'-O)-methyltransferase